MKPKTQKRTVESKKRLMQSAYELFVEKGYYNTNTKEMAKRANISIGNFYNYYNDKGDIYCALLENYSEGSCNAMKELLTKLEGIDNRILCKEFLLLHINQLLKKAVDGKKFFQDSEVVSKENDRVRSIILDLQEKQIDMLALFLKRKYSDKEEHYYIRARMLYIFTDQVARDILHFMDTEQEVNYINIFTDEILEYIYGL